MTNDFSLSDLQIASPCDAAWADMHGDAVKRHCNLCEKFVYNISEMPSAEALSFIKQQEGADLCVRLYKRADGTVKTSDCGAPATATRSWPLKLIATFLFAIFALLGGTALALGDSHYYKKLEDNVCKLLGIERQRQVVMGKVCLPPRTQPKTNVVNGSNPN